MIKDLSGSLQVNFTMPHKKRKANKQKNKIFVNVQLLVTCNSTTFIVTCNNLQLIVTIKILKFIAGYFSCQDKRFDIQNKLSELYRSSYF